MVIQMYRNKFVFLVNVAILLMNCSCLLKKKITCIDAYVCSHTGKRKCGLNPSNQEVRWFYDICDILEFNCEYKSELLVETGRDTLYKTMTNRSVAVVLAICVVTAAHGPPRERDNEDIAMGRKMGPKWCSMAKVCNHDRIPICGVSHAGDVMGFRDLCDMFDYNCIRRRNYKQTACPEDKSILTASRRPTNTYYDD